MFNRTRISIFAQSLSVQNAKKVKQPFYSSFGLKTHSAFSVGICGGSNQDDQQTDKAAKALRVFLHFSAAV